MDLNMVQCKAGQTIIRELSLALQEARVRMLDASKTLDHHTLGRSKFELLRGADAVTAALRRSGVEGDPNEPDW